VEELQHNKIQTKFVGAGSEFGMRIKTNVKIQVGDELESFEEKLKVKTVGPQ
jgi:translation initiation factor IF-2